MKPEMLLRHFDRLCEAPGAIPRLRRFILDLAVRGKLVEQDPNDEPASAMYSRIQAAKERSVKGRRPRSGIVRECPVDKPPFDIPSSWKWAPFGDIMISRDGERIPVSQEERTRRAKIYDYYGASGAIDKIDGYLFDQPLLLIGEDGANLINRSTPIAFIARGKYWVNNHAHVVDGISERFLKFMEIYINAIDLKPYVTGTAQPKMNQAKMNSIPVALPPEAEQHRIVSKVDELMALCDRLEAAQAERERRRDRLNAASLQRLNEPADAEAFREHARFHLCHLSRLTVRPDQIQQLRQTVLNLAVHGKLVAQEPNDEPASELVQRLEILKSRLIEETSIRRSKSCREFMSNEVPYQIPLTWVWVMLGDITDVGTGSTPLRTQPSFWHEGATPWTTSGSTSQAIISRSDEYVTEDAVRAHRLRLYQPGTLLVALYGQGKTRGQVAALGIASTINQACAAICPLPGFETMQAYLKLLLEKNYDEIRSLAAGGPQPNLNLQKVKEMFVPLPPLSEQHRIVVNVDEMFDLCDRLETHLTGIRNKRQSLLDALLNETLAGNMWPI